LALSGYLLLFTGGYYYYPAFILYSRNRTRIYADSRGFTRIFKVFGYSLYRDIK